MCNSDYSLPAHTGNGTVTIPKGTGIYIPVIALQHDPEYFPDPEKFDPERFTEEKKQKRPKYTYLAFGDGPRSCMGKEKHTFKMLINNMGILPSYMPQEDRNLRNTYGHKSAKNISTL
jgi:cytochrome P450 family 6